MSKMPDELPAAIAWVSKRLEERMDELLSEPSSEDTAVIAMRPGKAAKASEHMVEGEEKVLQAMRYSSLSGGKRLRPFLVVCSAQLFGVSVESAIETAVAIEFIHTYSLVHDDLPAMDNDALRRGKPSCHIKFGEAAAILAGDGLLTYAFEILSSPNVHADPAVRCELIRNVAAASGYMGMVGGQMMDLAAEHKTLNVDQIIRLQRMKTGALFATSCESGAILGKAPGMMRNVLKAYANDMGLAFQITDDLLDAEGTRKETGKAVNKDKVAGKATLVSAMGIERAREHAQFLVAQAMSHLEVFDKKADCLRNLASFVVDRRS